MRAEKTQISQEYLDRLKSSPYFIVVDYTGLKVGPITDLRKRLEGVRAEMHVVKNNLFGRAAQEAGIENVGVALSGQTAVVTGASDMAGAAKILKNFHAEFEKPKVRFGYLNSERLEAEAVMVLADLPPLDALRGKLVGLVQAPATKLVRVLKAPGEQLARLLKAKAEKKD